MIILNSSAFYRNKLLKCHHNHPYESGKDFWRAINRSNPKDKTIYERLKMIYSAKLKKMDETIEEFAYFSIENNDLYCFLNCCPMAIEVNKVYNVELDYFIIDEFILEEVNTD